MTKRSIAMLSAALCLALAAAAMGFARAVRAGCMLPSHDASNRRIFSAGGAVRNIRVGGAG